MVIFLGLEFKALYTDLLLFWLQRPFWPMKSIVALHYICTFLYDRYTHNCTCKLSPVVFFLFSALVEISKLLNTGLDPESLAICVKLCEAGVNPEALASVVQELRREAASLQVNLSN